MQEVVTLVETFVDSSVQQEQEEISRGNLFKKNDCVYSDVVSYLFIRRLLVSFNCSCLFF